MPPDSKTHVVTYIVKWLNTVCGDGYRHLVLYKFILRNGLLWQLLGTSVQGDFLGIISQDTSGVFHVQQVTVYLRSSGSFFINPYKVFSLDSSLKKIGNFAEVLNQWSGRFSGSITGWDPNVCKSNQLHVDILRFSFMQLRYMLQIPLNWPVIFLQSSSDFNRLFLKLNWFICNSPPVPLDRIQFWPSTGYFGTLNQPAHLQLQQ